MQPIGSRWRELRRGMRLDREPVATSLGITPKSLGNIETNQPKAVVSERLALRAARFFGVPVEELAVDGATPDGVPDKPPEQPPTSPSGPPGRTNGDDDDRRGPSTKRRGRKPGGVAA